MRTRVGALVSGAALSLTLGCSAPDPAIPTTAASPTTSSSSSMALPSGSSTSSEQPADVDTTPPRWLGSRPLPRTPTGYGENRPTPARLRHRAFTLPDTITELPGDGFASRTEIAPAAVIARSTWRPGCPVAADELAWVRVVFWGFDDQRHTGELLVNQSVAADVVTVFHRLWRAEFPIEQMRISTRADLDAEPTGDGNDTESFACRPAVDSTAFSQHAFGLAIDVDPFQNPYVKGFGDDRLVLPELASSYLDRDDLRPGMITPDGPVVAAFAAIGWTWGGTWRSLQDLQHFSQNGR